MAVAGCSGAWASFPDWRGDGVISRVESDTDADALASLGLPMVDVAGAYARDGFRSVTNDDFLTGYRAARSFRGFPRRAAASKRTKHFHETFRSPGRSSTMARETGNSRA